MFVQVENSGDLARRMETSATLQISSFHMYVFVENPGAKLCRLHFVQFLCSPVCLLIVSKSKCYW